MKRIEYILPLLFISILLVGCDSKSTDTTKKDDEVHLTETTYSNVLLPITSANTIFKGEIADPSIVRGDDGYFYVFSTARRVFRSGDGINFDVYTENIIPRPTYADGERYGIPEVWAPDCIKVQDKWIYYYSLAAWDMPSAGIGYAISDEIAGPYTDMGKLFDEDDIKMNGLIDPQPFYDDDGRLYMTVGSFHGNYLVELSEDGMSLKDGAAYQNENKSLIAGIPLTYFDNSYYEGGYIIKRDDLYYYFGSCGSCCEETKSTYAVYVGMASDVRGPYIDDKSRNLATSNHGQGSFGRLALWAGQSMNRKVVGPGHNSVLLDDNGDYWMYYHAYCDYDNYATRHLFVDKILWDDNDFPYIDSLKPSYEVELDGPKFK